MNNKFKAQTLTGNHTGNFRYHVEASRPLNMSCSFGQSACSTELRWWLCRFAGQNGFLS